MVTGDAVNAAARLEQTADAGQILVSERTARAARGFRFSDVGPLAVRGKSRPVATVELLDEGLDELPGGRERGVPGLRAPMVGRDHELELLRSTFGRLASSGRAQLVTIYGDPGIGKSRLTRELLAWADAHGDGVTVLKGRCLPYGEAITYWPLAEILKSYTGVLDSDPPDVALAKIAALADDVLAGVPDPARSAGVLAFTFGLEDPRFGLATLAPRQVRLETHEAWRAFFTGLTADRPAIVVVEDIHWADDPLLDLLEELADRVAGPLLFVCPARPDLAQRRTGWGGGKRNFSSIFLEPLSHDDAATLVEVLLAVEELPDETREAMLARADGNPLFLEEIIRQLIDEGRIVRDGRPVAGDRGHRRDRDSRTPSRPCSRRVSTCCRRSSGARSCPPRSSDASSGAVPSRSCSTTATSSRTTPSDGSRTASSCSRSSGRGSPASVSSSSSTCSPAMWRTGRSRAATALVRTPTSPPGSSRPPASGSPSSPTCSPTISVSPTKARSRTPVSRPTVATSSGDEASMQRWLRRQRRGAGCCSTRRMPSPRPPWASPLTPTRDRSPSKHSGCARSGTTAATMRGGTSRRPWTSVSPRVAPRARISRCSAPARSSLRRDGPHRWRNSRKRLPSPAMSRSASSTRRATARHACVCSSRVACGCSRSARRVHRRRGRGRAPGGRRGTRPRGSARTRRPRKRSARRRGERRVHRRPARADVARGGAQARDRRAAHGSLGSRRRVPDSGRHRARDRPLRRRAALGERGIRACPRRAGRLAGRARVAGDRSLQARRLGRSHRGLRTHGGRACDHAVRNRRVLHAHDVELYRAAPRASWRTSCSGQAGRRPGSGAPRYGDDPEDPVARKAVGAPRVRRGARANRGERVDSSAGTWPRARSWRRSAT